MWHVSVWSNVRCSTANRHETENKQRKSDGCTHSNLFDSFILLCGGGGVVVVS